MPQLTIDVPETLMPLLTRKAEIGRETPEEFIVSYLSVNLDQNDLGPPQAMSSEEQEHLEDILEERDKGPFVPVPDDLVERVMEKAMARIHRHKAHV
ncbi:hypothetical protein [Prosthecobacter sp.]|uniref:hypothetical protein n=1 Tax=Prosthecobacter sp. TaxID=1965333 RepID=UPI002488C2D3|nr:hypothetical protein [Prosthecobacter sp.]MDI1314597.1 hypothetical protein [Prosthecobacter sp.]